MTRQPLKMHHLAHDLRGPLNSILGFSELLIQGIEGPLNGVQTEDMQAIYQSAQNLLLLINTVVDISKLEAERMLFDFAPVDVGQVFQNLAEFDFGSAKPEEVEVVITQPDDLSPLRGDAGRVEQMILSLIRFAFTLKRSGVINLAAKESEQSITVQVNVPGAQIPASALADLFELGVTVDAAGHSQLGRGGLDLPLAQALAKSHGGEAWAENKGDIGATLFLKLPISAASGSK